MLHFKCSSCQADCEAAPEFAGKLVVCPSCGQSVSVPRDAAAITEQAPLPMPKRDGVVDDERWSGRSIAKDGGAAHIWLRNGVYVLVGMTVIVVIFALFVPATRHVHEAAARTQSINNLKQIALAANSFCDTNGRLPFNGADAPPVNAFEQKYTKEAVGGSFTSGSWAFQILPFIGQNPLFTNAIPPHAGIACYLCPGRGRPSFEESSGVPWTDYFYNNYLNDPLQAAKPDAADAKRKLVDITDGSSNTIFAGHGNINTDQYAANADVVGSTNIFLGGTTGTMRSGDNGGHNPTGVFLKRDSSENPGIGSWGSPFPQGALMAMCDGTVRMFPYAMQNNFGAFLTPTGGEVVTLPDT